MSTGTTIVKSVIGGVIIIFALILFVAINPFVKINAGERGIVMKWGAVQEEILAEGIHWITPIVKDVEIMDVTIQKEEKLASASSKDLQIVSTKVAVNYHLDVLKVNDIYQTMRHEFSDRVIAPAIDEFVKKITAQYTAEELITKREMVKQDLKQVIKENLAVNHILLDDIFITDFEFSPEFNRAIEAKVTAEQKALEEKNRLEQVKYQAEQRVAAATAEAEAIRIQAKAVTQQGGKDYVQLKTVEKWNGVLPVQMIPSGTVPFLDLKAK